MVILKSIINGKIIQNFDKEICYEKYFLFKYSDKNVKIGEISNLTLISDKIREEFKYTDMEVFFLNLHSTIKKNFDKYCLLLSIETNISLKQSSEKIESILEYIHFAKIKFNNEFIILKKRNIYLKKKGTVLISLSGSDPLEGLINSLLPALFVGNKVFIKPSRKSSLLIYELFVDLINFKEINYDFLNLLFISNDLFQEMLKKKYFDYVYWTGSSKSANEIHLKCVELGVEFYYDGPGMDFMYIDCSFSDWDLCLKIIMNSLTNLNGKNCNAIKYIFIDSSNYKFLVSKLNFFISKTEKLISLETKNLNVIGPLEINIIEDLKLKINKIKSEDSISSFDDSQNYFSPKIYLNPKNLNEILSYEFFGPILIIKEVQNFKEVIEYQNKSKFGLGFTLLSNNNEIDNLVKQLNVARINLNCDPLEISFFEPWGGVKNSGIGGPINWLEKFSNKLYIKNGFRN